MQPKKTLKAKPGCMNCFC